MALAGILRGRLDMAISIEPCRLLVSAGRLGTAPELLGTATQKKVLVGQLMLRIPGAGTKMFDVMLVSVFELDRPTAVYALTGLFDE